MRSSKQTGWTKIPPDHFMNIWITMKLWDAYKDMMKWLASVYVNALNIIHYMHDKYCYERITDGSA